MKPIERLEWRQIRSVDGMHEISFIIAQKNSGVWEFSEKTSWDIRWYKTPSTPALISQLRREISTKRFDKAKSEITPN
ncbi:MAG: hypothetical protein ABIA02_04250 [Candidatus Falkowbacteria bacterium]